VPKGDAPATEPVEGQAPERAPAGAEGAGAKAKAAWGVGVDYLALRGGHIRFRDFAVRGVEPVDVALPTIEVRDVALRPGIYGRPARAHLDVRVDEGRLRMNTQLRLIAHGVAVASVEVAVASVFVRPRGGEPLLVTAGAPNAGTPPAGTGEPARSPAADAKPWRWSVASVRVTDGRARVLAGDAPTDVGVELEARGLSGDGDEPAPVRLALRLGDGSLTAEGGLRVGRSGFAGSLTL